MHFGTQGFRANNDIDQNLYTAFFQGRVTSDFNVQTEFRHRDVENGFLGLRFAPTAAELAQQNTQRRRLNSDIFRVGAHWSPSLSSDVLASFAYQNNGENVELTAAPGVQSTSSLTKQTYSGEVQQIFRHRYFDATSKPTVF
jgi:hypothetical protein